MSTISEKLHDLLYFSISELRDKQLQLDEKNPGLPPRGRRVDFFPHDGRNATVFDMTIVDEAIRFCSFDEGRGPGVANEQITIPVYLLVQLLTGIETR